VVACGCELVVKAGVLSVLDIYVRDVVHCWGGWIWCEEREVGSGERATSWVNDISRDVLGHINEVGSKAVGGTYIRLDQCSGVAAAHGFEQDESCGVVMAGYVRFVHFWVGASAQQMTLAVRLVAQGALVGGLSAVALSEFSCVYGTSSIVQCEPSRSGVDLVRVEKVVACGVGVRGYRLVRTEIYRVSICSAHGIVVACNGFEGLVEIRYRSGVWLCQVVSSGGNPEAGGKWRDVDLFRTRCGISRHTSCPVGYFVAW
jgi:hypothetical protein